MVVIAVGALLGGCSETEQPFDAPATETGALEGSTGAGDALPLLPACDVSLDGELERLGVPGLSISVVKDGQVVCASVAGFSNAETREFATTDTPFTWASVSKTVTAVAVMVLVDDGLVSLDDDVVEHLEFGVRNPHCPGAPITIRQLLAHTSSIVDDPQTYDASYTDGDSPVELGDFVRDYLDPAGQNYDADDNFTRRCPGEINRYSNIGVGLLGRVVERASGVGFDEFCQARIFGPLGMTQTSFHLSELNLDAVALPHERKAGKFVPQSHFGFPTHPDGLLRSSAPHLATFLAMVASGGQHGEDRILSASAVDELGRVQYPSLDDTQGLLWYYDFGDRWIGHDGGDPGTSSMLFFDPATGVGAAVVANGDWYDENDEAPEARGLVRRLIEAGAP